MFVTFGAVVVAQSRDQEVMGLNLTRLFLLLLTLSLSHSVCSWFHGRYSNANFSIKICIAVQFGTNQL